MLCSETIETPRLGTVAFASAVISTWGDCAAASSASVFDTSLHTKNSKTKKRMIRLCESATCVALRAHYVTKHRWRYVRAIVATQGVPFHEARSMVAAMRDRLGLRGGRLSERSARSAR